MKRTVTSGSPADDGRHLADERLLPLRERRQANRLDVVGEADRSLELEKRQIIVESGTGELRMDADLANLEDFTLSRIGQSQVEVSESGRVLIRTESDGKTKGLVENFKLRNDKFTS